MSIKTVMENVYFFKRELMIKKADAATNPMTLKRRKKTTLHNERVRQQLVDDFDKLPPYMQPAKLLEFCLKFADVTSKPSIQPNHPTDFDLSGSESDS